MNIEGNQKDYGENTKSKKKTSLTKGSSSGSPQKSNEIPDGERLRRIVLDLLDNYKGKDRT